MIKIPHHKGFRIALIVIFSLFVILCSFTTQFKLQPDKISAHLLIQKVVQGKLTKIEADLFLNCREGKLTMHYTYPNEYIFITNSKGEAKVYIPVKNEVTILKSDYFSAENDVLFYFATGKSNDLGLKNAGFTINKTRFENELMITEWEPPVIMIDVLDRIEIVHENNLPIYSAYYNSKKQIVKKTYYSNYAVVDELSLPMRITEISYLPKNDSVVSRKEYSDLKTGPQAINGYFNYVIPKNARISGFNK